MNIQGPFTRIKYEDINLNSSEQVKDYLLSVGWVPTQYNINKETREPTSPKLTEDSYASIKDDTGVLLARRAVLVHRRIQIENYKDPENKGLLSYLRDDGRVPAAGITCASNTSRTKHRVIVNIPKPDPKILYGKEMRSLFRCIPPYKMVGCDLAAIENRVLCHFVSQFDGGAYWKHLNSVEDSHQYNADLLGCSRNTAKTFLYAFMFGASSNKLASILGCSLGEAEVKMSAFWESNPGLKKLIESLERDYKKHGFLVGLDGRKLSVRGKHKLLNTLIQSSAAIVFKRWGLLANERVQSLGLDAVQIIAMHDEYQFRTLDVDVDATYKVLLESARDAGIYYNLKVPVEAECKSGQNWAETH